MKKFLVFLLIVFSMAFAGCEKKEEYFDCRVIEIDEDFLVVELINDHSVRVKGQYYTKVRVSRNTLSPKGCPGVSEGMQLRVVYPDKIRVEDDRVVIEVVAGIYTLEELENLSGLD